MLFNILIVILAAIGILAMLGAALFPFAMLSGVWAHYSAKEARARAAEIEALLAED